MPIAQESPIAALSCPQCRAALQPDALTGPHFAACPHCQSQLRAVVFPAFTRRSPERPERAQRAAEGEAACFFHPANRADLSCERCGRFICAVCDMTIGARHICPTCLSSGLSGDKKMSELVPGRFLWAEASLILGLGPLLLGPFLWVFFLITAPTALFLAIRGWKRPGSIARGRRRWAAVLGILGGLIQLSVWAGFIFLVAGGFSR